MEADIMSEEKNIHDCIMIWNSFPVCIGDIVRVYPRLGRSLISIRGKVIKLSESAITIETENEIISIRFSEIKMISKVRG